MSKARIKTNIFLTFVVSAFIFIPLVGGCTAQQKDTAVNENAQSSQESAVQTEGSFISDEQCLSCHGESYEAVAELTADLGDWNPHDSIHGGYNTCVNCHEADQVLSYNYCSQCHAYAPDEESLFL